MEWNFIQHVIRLVTTGLPEQNAIFVEVGMWYRSQWFPLPGETHWRQSVDREVRQTRSSVGICDVTNTW